MKVEKRTTNKIGLIILVVIVLAGLAGGGYYLIKNKGKINIDWRLPWQKKGIEEQDSASDSNGGTNTKNGTTTFQSPIGIVTSDWTGREYCEGSFENFEETKTEIIVKYKLKGSRDGYPTKCDIEITKYTADGFLVSGSSKASVDEGEEKEFEIRILKSDLESQELSGINELALFVKYKTDREGENSLRIEKVSFNNERSVNNNKTGIKIDDLNGTIIQYYKTITDASNTYLYFLVENTLEKQNADIKIRKLIINDKVFDAKEFDEKMGPQTKKLIYVEVPKDQFNKVKKFTISFFNISTSIEDESIGYYISNEYSREL